MAHEDLTAEDVIDFVRQHWGTSVSQIGKRGDLEIKFVIYGAFAVVGSYDEYGRGNWGFAIEIGGSTGVSSVFGQRLSLADSRDAVLKRFAAIDRYARLRLGADYLEAFESPPG